MMVSMEVDRRAAMERIHRVITNSVILLLK